MSKKKGGGASIAERIDAMEEAYEFMLAYAARGLVGEEEGDDAGVRPFLQQLAAALDDLGAAGAMQTGDDASLDAAHGEVHAAAGQQRALDDGGDGRGIETRALQRGGQAGDFPVQISCFLPMLGDATAAHAEMRARRCAAIGPRFEDGFEFGGPAFAAAGDGADAHEVSGDRQGNVKPGTVGMNADAVTVGADLGNARRYKVGRNDFGRHAMPMATGTRHRNITRLVGSRRACRSGRDIVPPPLKSSISGFTRGTRLHANTESSVGIRVHPWPTCFRQSRTGTDRVASTPIEILPRMHTETHR